LKTSSHDTAIEHLLQTRLFGSEIIFQKIPTYVSTLPVPEVRHRRTDRQSDTMWQYRAVYSISREKEIIIS